MLQWKTCSVPDATSMLESFWDQEQTSVEITNLARGALEAPCSMTCEFGHTRPPLSSPDQCIYSILLTALREAADSLGSLFAGQAELEETTSVQRYTNTPGLNTALRDKLGPHQPSAEEAPTCTVVQRSQDLQIQLGQSPRGACQCLVRKIRVYASLCLKVCSDMLSFQADPNPVS